MIHKALFVMSAQNHLTLKDGTQHPTGFYASEFLEPYDTFKQAGMQIDVATPGGVVPTVDPVSLNPALQAGLQRAPELTAPRRLEDVKASDYDVIFVPGGHAPVEDLPYNKSLGQLLSQSHTLVAALCHGPAALLSAVDPQGRWLYAGHQLTSFSKAEEDLTPVAGKMKWELEDRFRAEGGLYSKSAASTPFEGYVMQDGMLITGENPNSAALIGPKVVQALQGQSSDHSVTFSVHRDVAAPPDQVWASIGKFDTMPWHPGLESGSVQGDVRKLTAKGGGPVFTEKLLAQGAHFLRYQMVDGLPLHPIATLRVEPNGTGSRIVWEADMDTSSVDAKTAQAVTQGVTGFYEAGLNAIAARIE